MLINEISIKIQAKFFFNEKPILILYVGMQKATKNQYKRRTKSKDLEYQISKLIIKLQPLRQWCKVRL